ncbi:MAG TPA: SAM-dependent methyltransferase [Sphingomicrobium sp.]|jgi:SAM-dependent methyltransferase
MPDLFDNHLRALRRDRAARLGTELFLFDRVFEDCLERIALMDQRFESALLIGCPDPTWPERLKLVAERVDVRDPAPLFAAEAGGSDIQEDRWEPLPTSCDLVVAIGTLDTVNDLPVALRLIGHGMKPGALFIGAVAGGDTLPQLRGAMRAADALGGGAAAHVHPRIEPAALAPLLESAGFIKPVVDVDRVQLSYRSMAQLVGDLRRMGATNVLTSRSPSLTRAQAHAAAQAFSEAGNGERTKETIEVLHFVAWTPAKG